MFLEIKNVLSQPDLASLQQLASKMSFLDGRASNSGNTTKQNLQGDPRDAAYAESVNVVGEALRRSREFADFALPRRFAPPMLARYEPGMKYGPHADAAYLPLPSGSMRSDVSCTVFVSEPSAYEGGELVIHLGARALPVKFAAGSAILYPSTTLHEVLPVRSGTRLVSLTFVESFVPDAMQRGLVYELGEISALEGNKMDWLSRTRLEVVRQNLLRMWSGG
jgi:PKHD-type hydroxylase